jgi:hypothetical protein
MLVSGLTATPAGLAPTVIFSTTLFVVPFIIEVVLEAPFATYTILVSGLTATPYGVAPTGTLATSLFAVPFIIEVVPETVLVTYVMLVFGLIDIPFGDLSSWIESALPAIDASITDTVLS